MLMRKSVIEGYSELYHYTTAIGLHGIVTSQQLWATHISYLNDAQELTGFFEHRLPKLLKVPVNSAIEEAYKSAAGRDHINTLGGVEKVKAELVSVLHTAIRDTTLRFNQPYVTSFCGALQGHALDDGLLSQWRGYGPDGGYAIVFDTQGLQALLEDESKRFHYQSLYWGDVQYYERGTSPKVVLPETVEWESILHQAVERFILTQKREELEPLLEAITPLSSFHKHIGFFEESEVRIIALPSSAELLEEAQKAGDNRPRKSVRFLPRDGMLLPYIALFKCSPNEEAAKLPITKVIVGPHPEKLKRQKAVELLLKQCAIDAEVIASDIPYLGR